MMYSASYRSPMHRDRATGPARCTRDVKITKKRRPRRIEFTTSGCINSLLPIEIIAHGDNQKRDCCRTPLKHLVLSVNFQKNGVHPIGIELLTAGVSTAGCTRTLKNQIPWQMRALLKFFSKFPYNVLTIFKNTYNFQIYDLYNKGGTFYKNLNNFQKQEPFLKVPNIF